MTAASPTVLEFFAACPRHVPDLLAGELRALGLDVAREHPAGVSFTGPLRDGYLEQLRRATDSLKRICRGMHIDFERMNTGQSLDVSLSGFLATRAASMK